MTEFSSELRWIQETAKHLLVYARRYRKDRHWSLTPEDAKPLRERWAWSYDEAGVRAWYASSMGREWPETIEWPEEIERAEEECPPPSARRILEYLASGAHGAFTYRIWMSSSGDGQRQRPSRPRRPRPPRVLPSGSPSLLLTVFRQAPDDLYSPPPEQRDVTQRIQEVERRIAHLNRLEGRAIFDTGQWEDAAAYRQERRGLWQELQTLKASLPPPQGLQDKAPCKAVTMTVGLDEMSQQEQRRWRKKLGHSPRTTWLVKFREYLCRHPQMGRNPIYIDMHTTTEDDVTVQVLAYLLQAEMVLWEDIEPWVKHYAAAGGQETEGKRWDTCLRRTWCQDMLEFAIPQEANALRPALPAHREPEEYSIPQASKVLGITERQLRYKIEHEEIPGVEKLGRRVSILPEALEHLRPQVVDQARRQQDKTRRAIFVEKAKNEYGMTADAIRQMIHRGPQTPEGTPDGDALEAQLKRKAAAQRGDNQRPSLSEDEMRKLIAHLDGRHRSGRNQKRTRHALGATPRASAMAGRGSPVMDAQRQQTCGLSPSRPIRQPPHDPARKGGVSLLGAIHGAMDRGGKSDLRVVRA